MKRVNYSIGLIAAVICLLAFPSDAQDQAGKGSIKIDLAFHQLNDDLPVIKVSAKTKKDKRFQPVEGAEINVFLSAETSQGFMGRVKTNNHGAASLSLPERLRGQLDSLPGLKFIGTLTQDDRFEDQSTELEIVKAKIALELDVVDSVRTIHAKVLALTDKGWVVQPETEIKLVVRRLQSDLAATEEETFTTDENGEVSSEFKLTIPGDAEGNIIIGAKIDDHEAYGNLVSAKPTKWGIPLAADHSFSKRTLWATRDKTPLWLLIFPNLIIISVWGIIFFLLYQIVRIVKLGRTNDQYN